LRQDLVKSGVFRVHLVISFGSCHTSNIIKVYMESQELFSDFFDFFVGVFSTQERPDGGRFLLRFE